MFLGILAILAIFGIPALLAYYGWIVPFMESSARNKPDTCYVGTPCGTCRACQIANDQEYTIATVRSYTIPASMVAIPSLVGTRNIRKVS